MPRPRERDRWGRPLPAGVAPAQAWTAREQAALEGATGPLGHLAEPDLLAIGQELLATGLPFHAHELFEDRWRIASEAQRGTWQGLAQLAAGLAHAGRGNPAGAARLVLRGADRLRSGAVPGLDVEAVRRWARAAAPALTASDAVGPPPLLMRPLLMPDP